MGDIHGIFDMMGQKSMMFPYGYGSIPIFFTIFSGMNIHLPAILMWTTGVQGFDTLPYERGGEHQPTSYFNVAPGLAGSPGAAKDIGKAARVEVQSCLCWGVEAAKSGILRNIG